MSKRGLQLHCKLQCYNVDFLHVDFIDFRLMPELKHNSGIRLCLVLSPLCSLTLILLEASLNISFQLSQFLDHEGDCLIVGVSS